jgi:hypothetical protein
LCVAQVVQVFVGAGQWVERQSTSLMVLCLVDWGLITCLLKGGFSLKWQRFCFTLLGLSLAVLGCTFQFQPHTGSHVKKWWKMAREQARYSLCFIFFYFLEGNGGFDKKIVVQLKWLTVRVS